MRRELQLRVAIEWGLIQLILAGVLITAWLTHLRFLANSAEVQYAHEGWLSASYFHPESQSPIGFVWASTIRLFTFLFANVALAPWMAAIFVLGIVLILLGKAGVRDRRPLPALMLLLPPGVTAVAGLLSLYPYGGTRHDAFLGVFLAAGIAVGISALTGRRVLIMLILGVCLMPSWFSSAESHYLDDPAEISTQNQMKRLLDYMSTVTPGVLVVDMYAFPTLNYYVCPEQNGESTRTLTEQLDTYRCGKFQVLRIKNWKMTTSEYWASLVEARVAAPNLFPDPAWEFHLAADALPKESPAGETGGSFGKLELYRLFRRQEQNEGRQ